MLEGGRIVVRLRTCRLDASELVRFGLPAAGRFHLLEIEDHGIGIEPQLMEHIFEPFYTTKAPGKGTGLGLSIVYSVVREHRGGVVVESTPGAGALFSLAFPACDEATSEEPRRVEDARGAGEETILLVEDEPSVRRLLLRTFERAGYRVIEAANGERALALLATKGPSWMDLLVTDIVMPGINGGELARRVRELDPEMPVLYVSGHPQDRGPSEADPNLPAGRYLTKPFQKNRLLSEVRLALDGE
jgi:CheY-like chemotaxis protein